MNLRLSIVLLALPISACIIRSPNRAPVADYLPATLEGRRIQVVDQSGSFASLSIEADWVIEGEQHCVRDGRVSIATPAGSLDLYRTSACVTLEPFSMVGEAEVPFPALGYLSRVGVEGNAPRAKIALGLGKQLRSIDIAGEAMKLDPSLFYLSVDYYVGLSASIGRVTLSTPAAGARLVIAPQEPMIYVAGSLTGVIDDAGLGFSASGRLPFSPRDALFDGSQWRKQRFTGHVLAHGTMPVHPYPLSIGGRILLDVDADDDGVTMFEGDTGDLSVAADGALSLGYDKAGFGFSIEMARASLAYDGKRNVASFAAETGGSVFAGTPLAVLDAGRGKMTLRGFYQSPTRFEVTASMRKSALAGFALGNATLSLGAQGIAVRGRAEIPAIGSADVEGRLGADGRFSLRGKADLTVAGFRMVGADVTLANNGVHIAGTVNLPGLGRARVAGKVQSNGHFALTGSGDLRPVGLRLANAKVTLTSRGAAISGSIKFLGSTFAVKGKAGARGQFGLSGSLVLDAAIVRGRLSLAVSNRRAAASINGKACITRKACVDLPGMELDTRGRVCPTFPVVGRKCIRVKR